NPNTQPSSIATSHQQHNHLSYSPNTTPPYPTYTLSLHDALPISGPDRESGLQPGRIRRAPGYSEPAIRGLLPREAALLHRERRLDRKSTRLNSSHDQISYAVFCLKKKRQTTSHRKR